MQVSGSGSTSERPKVSPRQSRTKIPSGSRDSSPVRGGSEERASSPVLIPAGATAVDVNALAALKVEKVGVEGSGLGAGQNSEDDRTASPVSKSGSMGGNLVDDIPSIQKDGRAEASFAGAYSPHRYSESVHSSLLVSTPKSALKSSSRLSGSIDSSYGLSPDVIAMKQHLRTQTTDQGVRANLFDAPSPGILRNASQILKKREADHEAEKQGLRVELVSLLQQITELTSDKRELVQESDAVRLQITDYKARLLEVSSDLTRGAAELKALESKYTKTKAILTEKADVLASEVREKQQHKEALERTLQSLDAQKSFLEQTHRGKIEELEGQYRERQAGLAASVAALESQLSGAQSQILEQVESLADMRTKHHSTLEKNKVLEANNRALEKANKEFLRTQANSIDAADLLRSELEDQKMLVAKLQWVIANPSKDISEFPTAKVAHEPAPEGRKSLSFGATPDDLPSKSRQSAKLDESSLGAVPISGEDDASAALLNRSETEEPITSTLPRQESLESVLSSTTVSLTLQQKRAQQAAEERRLIDEKKAQRAEKAAVKNDA